MGFEILQTDDHSLFNSTRLFHRSFLQSKLTFFSLFITAFLA